MTIKDLGARVVTVWEGLRPMTRKMIVQALQGTLGASAAAPLNISKNYAYDAHADWELSRLLTTLDEQAANVRVRKNAKKLAEIRRMAHTIADVLEAQTESAEIFIQLAERALKNQNYTKLDKLADIMTERFSVGEVAEIARQTTNGAVKALSLEALALMPVQSLVSLIDDPLYGNIVRLAVEQQAYDYDSEEAQELLDELDS